MYIFHFLECAFFLKNFFGMYFFYFLECAFFLERAFFLELMIFGKYFPNVHSCVEGCFFWECCFLNSWNVLSCGNGYFWWKVLSESTFHTIIDHFAQLRNNSGHNNTLLQ